ncbi:peptidase S1 [Microbacterium sp. Y-01]|uniref:S1 family peptidase n=1 Tax=Microbacterium sp. Y-01 TaxID=2048898 RepID=UPI000F5F9E8D|nr:serine protease [Microbacterium sp. Y-01]AZH77127.1 peptidase S1 [Microbacterium sp. Y-01]
MKSLRFIMSALLAAALLFAGTAPALAVSNGEEASEKYPFVGAYKPGYPVPPGAGGNGCGVTLIDPHWGVTAAHCLKNNLAQYDSPIGWTVQFASPDVTKGGEVATVSRYFRMSAPGELWWGKDVMLLRFDTAVSQTPIPVASEKPTPGTSARIVGWGDTSIDASGVYPKMLQEGDVEVLPPSGCPSYGGETTICVGGEAKTGNADSGGPLLVRQGDGWAIAGVLSGPDPRNADSSGVYTELTRHLDWIRTIMATHESIPDDEIDMGTGGFPAFPNCESSIVRTAASQDDDPALLLTNGHCVPNLDPGMEMPEPGSSIVDEKVEAPISFIDAGGFGFHTARIDRLLFATMTGTDVAVYRLDASYAELEQRGVRVLRVTSTPPKTGDKVTLMATDFLLGGPRECTIEAVVPTLSEDGYEQHDSLRMSEAERCKSQGGYSRAALLAADGKTLVGVNNSSNHDGKKCVLDNPCEVSADGEKKIYRERPYGQQIVELNDCVAAGSVLDLDADGCDLAADTDPPAIGAGYVLGAVILVVGGAVVVWIIVTRSGTRSRRNAMDPAATSDDR